MCIEIDYRRDEDLTVFTATGELTFAAQVEALKSFYEGKPTRYVIWDLTGITGNRVSSEELRDIIAYTKRHADKRPGGKTALVVSTRLDFGLGRMGGAMAEIEDTPWEVVPFYTLDEALAFIAEDRDG